MDSKAKGNVGHRYTEQYLQERGWSVATQDHKDITWRDKNTYEWRVTGSNDFFAVPKEDGTKKKEGGFDHVALKGYNYTLIQTKKTKADPIRRKNGSLKREALLCIKSADYYSIPRSRCFLFWWPNGVGPKKGPVIWRADQK